MWIITKKLRVTGYTIDANLRISRLYYFNCGCCKQGIPRCIKSVHYRKPESQKVDQPEPMVFPGIQLPANLRNRLERISIVEAKSQILEGKPYRIGHQTLPSLMCSYHNTWRGNRAANDEVKHYTAHQLLAALLSKCRFFCSIRFLTS